MLVYVNEVEMIPIGAGMGLDPFDILIPTNRLSATPQPHAVPIARCDCGTHGCGSTNALIVRDGDVVHWVPNAPLLAAAGQYPEAQRRRGTTHPTMVRSAVRDWLGADH